jgi:tetratricopeptide (TPR) repeat protein
MELGSRYNQLSQVGSNTASAQDKATKAYLKALSLNENLLPALASLGMHYTDVGKHEEAHEMLIRAIKLNPNDAYLHFSLSYHYRYIGFLEESKKEAEIALSIDPNNSRFRSSIITDMFLGGYKEILENFKIDIDSPFTMNYLGEVAVRAGNYELAKTYFRKVQNLQGEVSELFFATSLIEYMDGNTEKAYDFNLKRELENPADSEIFYEIARIYGLLNKPDACSRALRKSIDLGYVSYPSMQLDAFLNDVRNYPEVSKLIEKAHIIYQKLKSNLNTSY